jgi:hypothetical protein
MDMTAQPWYKLAEVGTSLKVATELASSYINRIPSLHFVPMDSRTLVLTDTTRIGISYVK